jgi:hypothetical protein
MATADQYTNTGVVTGRPRGGPFPVADGDPRPHFGKDPRVIMKKRTNGHDADTSTGPLSEAGSAVGWAYLVSRAGNVPLSDITDTDSQGVTAPGLPAGFSRSESKRHTVMFLTQRQWMAKWTTAATIITTPLQVWVMSQVVRLTRNMGSHPG